MIFELSFHDNEKEEKGFSKLETLSVLETYSKRFWKWTKIVNWKPITSQKILKVYGNASYSAFLGLYSLIGLIHNIFEVSDVDYETIKKFGSFEGMIMSS